MATKKGRTTNFFPLLFFVLLFLDPGSEMDKTRIRDPGKTSRIRNTSYETLFAGYDTIFSEQNSLKARCRIYCPQQVLSLLLFKKSPGFFSPPRILQYSKTFLECPSLHSKPCTVRLSLHGLMPLAGWRIRTVMIFSAWTPSLTAYRSIPLLSHIFSHWTIPLSCWFISERILFLCLDICTRLCMFSMLDLNSTADPYEGKKEKRKFQKRKCFM